MPLRWQGWVVMALFIAAMIAGAPLVKKGVVFYIVYGVAVGSALVCICYWKGEKPKWRWGSRE